MGKWKPDKEFIEFLEWLEKKDGQVISSNGDIMLDEIKNGTQSGQVFYNHLYSQPVMQEAYENWRKRYKKGR